MKKLLAAALLALPGLPPASAAEKPPATVTAARPSPEQQQWLSRGRRTERDGWIHLRIDGAARERGFQHGYLLASEIEASLRTTRKRWEYRSGMDWPWLVGKAEAMFLPRIDAELLAEIDGMVEGLGVAGVKTSRGEMIAYNGITELAGYWWPEVKATMGARSGERSRGRGCSPRWCRTSSCCGRGRSRRRGSCGRSR